MIVSKLNSGKKSCKRNQRGQDWVRTHYLRFRDQNGHGDDLGDEVMTPGSIALLWILPSFLPQMDCHAVQMREWPGVLCQPMFDLDPQPNWANEIAAKLSIVSVPVQTAEAIETTIHRRASARLVSPARRAFLST
jgi:hypothetical protein